MSDMNFLKALEDYGIDVNLKTDIPMTIRIKIVETNLDGQWTVKPRGRSVVEVVSPRPESIEKIDHKTKQKR